MSTRSRFAIAFALLFGTGLEWNALAAQEPPPRFEDFLVSTLLPERSNNAIIGKRVGETTDEFQNRLRQVAKEGPNFAGHYAVVRWQEGELSKALIVDSQTLESHELPFVGVFDCWHHKQDTLLYRIDSALLVVQGWPEPSFEPRSSFSPDPCGTYYFRWTGTALTGVAAVLRVPYVPFEISGRVVDADGSPVRKFVIGLLSVHRNWLRKGFTPSFGIETDQNGRFSATVPADRYNLVLGGKDWATKLVRGIDGEVGGYVNLGDVVVPSLLPTPPDVLNVTPPAIANISGALASILTFQPAAPLEPDR